MKTLLIASLFGLTSFLTSINTSTNFETKKEKPCKSSPDFEKDSLSGIVKFYEPGGKGFSNTYERLMLKRHNVEYIITDRFVLTPEQFCYNSFSKPFITEKFGDSVFLKTRIDANKMDRDGRGDRVASMSPETDSLISRYFHTKVNPDLYRPYLGPSHNNELVLYTMLYADSTGKIFQLYQSGLRNKPIDTVLQNLATNIPYRITPALNDGQKDTGRVHIWLKFSEKTASLFKPSE